MSFFSVVSLAYAVTTLGDHIFTSGTLTSQGKAYLTGGVSTPVLNATSSLIDNLSVNNLRATSTLDYWLANAPTTDNLREGTKNLYYTDQRVANYVNNNSFLTVSTTNLIAQNALLSQATIPTLNSTSSLIDNLTITNTTTANHINLPDTIATNGNKGIIYKDGVPFLYNFSYGTNAGGITPYGNNLFLGKDAGNLTMGNGAAAAYESSNNLGIGRASLHNNTTGYTNTGIGNGVLYNNTTGYRNVGLGFWSLYSNTTGANNMAIGYRSLFNNISGTGNVGVGTGALYSNTTGSWNMALGSAALGSNVSGIFNIAIGEDALHNSLGSNNIGIGYNVEPLATDDNNEIIIGTNAVGAGSNSVVLGNDNITKTLLKGNVAIGTTTPAATLTVVGDSYLDGTVTTPILNAGICSLNDLTVANTTTANHINLPNTTAADGNKGIIYKNGIPFLYNFSYGTNANGITPYGHNLFLGHGAGNLTMGSTATLVGQSSYNIGIGYDVLYNNTTGNNNMAIGNWSLFSNTGGYNNMAIGTYTLRTNTTGANNAAIGISSLYFNTTGNNNTAIGTWALHSNTIGHDNTGIGLMSLFYNTSYNNVAIGSRALFSNTNGYDNTAIGTQAGRYTSALLSNATSTNSLYLGANTQSLASGDTNEIVIGYGAIGAGSNSVVLGNDNITKTLLKGNVGIGTTTPSSLLDVSGESRAATSTITIGSGSSPACLKLRDADGLGWTYCDFQSGAMYCTTTDICD